MKEPELNKKVFQALQEFESMENIEPSLEWSNSLLHKIAIAQPNSHLRFTAKNTMLILSLIILANAFFVFKSITNHQEPGRNEELQLVSKEFLFNPTLQNN